jgi:hypothetical protein
MNTFASMNSLCDEFITEKRSTEDEGESDVVYFLTLLKSV